MSDDKDGVKNVFISCADSSTLHGLPKIASSKQLAVKCLWCFIVLGALGLCTFQICELITTYYTYPVQTSVSLHNSKLDFPAITICNMNPIRFYQSFQDDKLEELLYGKTADQNKDSLGDEAFDTVFYALDNDTDDSNVDNFYVWAEQIMARFRELDPELRKAMGHQRENFIHSAKLGGFNLPESYFNLTLSPVYGNCYTMGLELQVKKTGPRHGLQLVLNLEKDEYIDHFTSGAGARVVIHERNTLPHPEENGISLSPGYETNIALKLIQLERLGPPYGDCSDSNYVDDNSTYIYTTQYCQQRCSALVAIINCGCMPYTTRDEYNLMAEVCQTNEHIACSRDLPDSQCDCKNRCREKEFTSVISGRQWPALPFLNRVIMKESCDKNMSSMEGLCDLYKEENVTSDNFMYFANNFVAINIYFEQLNYQEMREQPMYDPVSLLSDIGGTMSFYLGASVLTYLEIFQFILELILYCKQARSQPKTYPEEHELKNPSPEQEL